MVINVMRSYLCLAMLIASYMILLDQIFGHHHNTIRSYYSGQGFTANTLNNENQLINIIPTKILEIDQALLKLIRKPQGRWDRCESIGLSPYDDTSPTSAFTRILGIRDSQDSWKKRVFLQVILSILIGYGLQQFQYCGEP